MKTLIYIFLSLTLISCNVRDNIKNYIKNLPEEKTKTIRVNSYDYKIITIDSCEYITTINQLAHKGNCKYCAERRKKELEEYVRIPQR